MTYKIFSVFLYAFIPHSPSLFVYVKTDIFFHGHLSAFHLSLSLTVFFKSSISGRLAQSVLEPKKFIIGVKKRDFREKASFIEILKELNL